MTLAPSPTVDVPCTPVAVPAPSQASTAPWWRDAVVYQVFLPGFADGNGDGTGDLAGLASRMPYLAALGVDAVWITPHYASPMADGGYDIADHTAVHPDFGTLDDYDTLLAVAHAHGIRVMVDIVPNHVSDQHPWFQAALAGDPDARERFIFRPGRGDGPPNNWQSLFGGPAWTLDNASGEYFLHLFSPEQPDLNWRHPAVAPEYERILRFWLDRGTDGVRIDVAAGLFKDEALRDNPGTYSPGLFGHGPEQVHTWDQPEVHDIYRQWNQILASYPHQPASVGEVCLADLTATAAYCRPDELGSAFTIELLKTQWGAGPYAQAIAGPLAAFGAVGARPAWTLANHDKSRMPSRFGGGETGAARARAAAVLLTALPGQLYVYAGDELGLPDAPMPDSARKDPIFTRSGGARVGRDGVRVPLPWDADADHCGFGADADTALYLPQPDGWASYAVDVQERDQGSFLNLYKTLLDLRRAPGPFGTGNGTVECDGEVLVVRLEHAGQVGWCVLNTGAQDRFVHGVTGRVLASSGPGVRVAAASISVPPDTACWVLADRQRAAS